MTAMRQHHSITLLEDVISKAVFMACMQVQQHLEGPIGMALYEWQDGQIGMACVHGGMHIVIANHAYAVTYICCKDHCIMGFINLVTCFCTVWHIATVLNWYDTEQRGGESTCYLC